eukprot:TRINITY_DN67855_c0_g1_i1.p1 TRINITY_DN67855_c0_g1~~TRINITY_DN67855_c0_g1_i1.p1  ORF type:complete len:371 (+),score=68.19 TRINITY_DN67855_c0_g1_i1:82-1194(+)
MASNDEPEGELIWKAVEKALGQSLHLEGKVEKKIRNYFRKAAKGLEFGRRPWKQLINDYADNALGALFTTFGDQPWLEDVDFLLVLDAGIKDNFPKAELANIPRLVFEKTVLEAYERAFDEQRTLPIVWETIKASVSGQQSQKKLYNAIEHGRKMATVAARNGSEEEFLRRWIDASIDQLAVHCDGDPAWMLSLQEAIGLFHSLIRAGSLPRCLVEGDPQLRASFASRAVEEAYSPFYPNGVSGLSNPRSTIGGQREAGSTQAVSGLGRYQKYRQGKGGGRGPVAANFYLGYPGDAALLEAETHVDHVEAAEQERRSECRLVMLGKGEQEGDTPPHDSLLDELSQAEDAEPTDALRSRSPRPSKRPKVSW